MAHDSENAREWFEQKPEPIPGQMDLLSGLVAAESRPGDSPATTERVRRNGARGRSSAGANVAGDEPASAASRPASTERPPGRPMTVAEVVDRKLRG